MAEIVLVHGAFHGSWCWRELAQRLGVDGHRIFTPTLTGLGERSHLLTERVDLDTHIQDIVNLFRWEELEHAVLVGHSYGGMPTTGAADQLTEQVSALVYLDAIVPEDGQSLFSIRSADPKSVPLADSLDSISVPAPPATVFGLEGNLANLCERRLTPHPRATLTQPIRLTGAWRQVPKKLYIRCSQYPGRHFDRYLAMAEADPDWIGIGTEFPHDIMMTDPDWLADILREHVL